MNASIWTSQPFSSGLVVDRCTQVLKRKKIKHMVSVVVEDARVVFLFKVTHDYVVVVPVFFPYHRLSNFKGDGLLNPL